jgi:aryl carrier-like protein
MATPADQNQNLAGGSLLSETETKVAPLWEEVLQRSVASSHDNFFDLGGDSVMMMMVIFRVGEVLGVELPQGVLIETPTLKQFCQLIDKRKMEAH